MERLSCYDHKNNTDVILYVHDNSGLKMFDYILEDIFGYPLVICDIENNTDGINNNGLYIKMHHIKSQIAYDKILVINKVDNELKYSFTNSILTSTESNILYNLIKGNKWFCTINDEIYSICARFNSDSRFIELIYEGSSLEEMNEYLDKNKSNILFF